MIMIVDCEVNTTLSVCRCTQDLDEHEIMQNVNPTCTTLQY